jgi:hypothetical protein
MQTTAVVNAESICQIVLQLIQTFWTADANAIVGRMRVKMFKQQTTTVLQITKPTSFSMQTTAVVNAESICQIALQLNQTFWTADANALVGRMQVKMFKQQTTTVSQTTKPTSFSMQTTAAVNAESIWPIAPLLMHQTLLTAAANAIV